MTAGTFYLALIGLLILSGVFSGSETGVYSLSRPRVEAEARQGRAAARILDALLSSKAALLVTLLVGNNLVMELATYLAEKRVHGLHGLPSWAREIAVTLGLTPVLFFFGEVLPKDLFRRRPHQLLALMAPVLWLTRVITLPITLPLYGLSKALERLFSLGGSDLARAFRRQEMLQLFAEGARSGLLTPSTEDLARNVLVLRKTRVAEVAVPWERVSTIDLDLAPEALTSRILESSHSRLVAVRGTGGVAPRVEGYLHQLDFLRPPGDPRKEPDRARQKKAHPDPPSAAREPLAPRPFTEPLERLPAPPLAAALDPETHLRTIPTFDPSLPVHEALGQLRVAGQRLALVGTSENPEGLVTLMDLVSVIAGQAAFRPLSATATHG